MTKTPEELTAAHLSLGEIGTSVTPINILIARINAALNESEE